MKLSKSCTKCNSGDSDDSSSGSNSLGRFSVREIDISFTPKFSLGLVYDADTSSLLWVDYGVNAGKPCIYRYNTNTRKTYAAYIEDGESLGAPVYIIPLKSSSSSLSKLVIGVGRAAYIIKWDGSSESATIYRKLELGSEGDLGPKEILALGHRNPKGIYYSVFFR